MVVAKSCCGGHGEERNQLWAAMAASASCSTVVIAALLSSVHQKLMPWHLHRAVASVSPPKSRISVLVTTVR